MSLMLAVSDYTSARYAPAFRLCPLCHTDEIEYEFVVEGVAFSRCRACTFFFANPASERSSGVPVTDFAEVADDLSAFAARYIGRRPETVLIIGDEAGAAFPDIDRCAVDAVATLEKRYDLVLAPSVFDRDPAALDLASQLRGVVAPGGVLLASVPSIVSADALAQRSAWPPLRSKSSWFFNTDTLALFMMRAGFGDFAPVVAATDIVVRPSMALRKFLRSNVILAARPVEPRSGRLLSVIVPVFNEARTVDDLLRTVLAKTIPGVDIEIVVVESNSTDGSREIVQRYAGHPRITLVLEDRPRGKGFAVRAGLAHAKGDVILFQDADLEYDINDYDRLVEPLFEGRRMFLLGSRHGAGTSEGWKIRRFDNAKGTAAIMNIAHLGLLTMFNKLYAQKLTDPFTMFKVFRRECLHGLSFECNRFDFDYEISIKLIRKGYRPIEIPVNYESRSFDEGKKVRFFQDPPTWIRAMLRLRRVPLYRF